MISIVKNNGEAKLDYEVFPPPPLPPMIYILNWITILLDQRTKERYIYTYTQTPYGWSQSWNIIHRNGFPVFGVKSRIQTLNSHTFISKINTEHKTILIQMLISSGTPSHRERETHKQKKQNVSIGDHITLYVSIPQSISEGCWSKNRSSITESRDILNDVIPPLNIYKSATA